MHRGELCLQERQKNKNHASSCFVGTAISKSAMFVLIRRQNMTTALTNTNTPSGSGKSMDAEWQTILGWLVGQWTITLHLLYQCDLYGWTERKGRKREKKI